MVGDIIRLPDVHHAFYRKPFAEIIGIAKISAVQLEATVVVLRTETCVEASEYLNKPLALGLFRFHILRL